MPAMPAAMPTQSERVTSANSPKNSAK
jgi:hypothetical protein